MTGKGTLMKRRKSLLQLMLMMSLNPQKAKENLSKAEEMTVKEMMLKRLRSLTHLSLMMDLKPRWAKA